MDGDDRRNHGTWIQLAQVVQSLGSGGVLLLSVAGPASAQDDGSRDDENDQVVLTGQLLIETDRTVDTAVIFNGRATIEGTVREDLFVMNGDTEISGTVNGDVVVFNGDVTVRSGAEIGGDLVTQSTPQVEDGATIRGSQTNVATKFDYDMGPSPAVSCGGSATRSRC